MSIYEYDEERQRIWDREEGLRKGEERFATLASALIEAGRPDDILKATKDIEYRKKLYKEYEIQ